MGWGIMSPYFLLNLEENEKNLKNSLLLRVLRELRGEKNLFTQLST